MRADARNLLERLGKQDFAYKEFTDRFSDLELWPVFEALLADKRLFSEADAPVAVPELARAAAPASHPPAEAPSHSGIFAKYDEAARARSSTPAPQRPEGPPAPSLDVRAMLQQLNDLTRHGDL